MDKDKITVTMTMADYENMNWHVKEYKKVRNILKNCCTYTSRNGFDAVFDVTDELKEYVNYLSTFIEEVKGEKR